MIQLQTSFGGGKTHTLLTLFHLLKRSNEVGRLPQVQEVLHGAGIREIPSANVTCLVGTAMDAGGERTFWGEMAYQLGGQRLYRLVEENDKRKTSPGTDLLGKLLDEAGPCLILLDEILVYLVKAAGVSVGEGTLRGNTLGFLQELKIAVSNCPHTCMIATLTSQLSEFFEEGAERVHESLEKVLGRTEKVRQTVEGTEIYEVIRRRLFEDLSDEADRRAAAEAYWENWMDLYNEVVQPLASEGAELYCQVVIVARGDAAIRENTVELGIKESLGQRGIEADIQTG